jgi:hypothetical protein
MNRCEVLTPWVSVNGRNVAQVIVDHPAAAPGSWTDTTGQATVPPASAGQPLPNTAIFYGEVDDATLAGLQADGQYMVLWSEGA